MLSKKLLEDALALDVIDKNLFRGKNPLWHPLGNKGVFGGAIAAQALSAAMKTVDPELDVHSIHSYFVVPYETLGCI